MPHAALRGGILDHPEVLLTNVTGVTGVTG